jgi:hypothetical protein
MKGAFLCASLILYFGFYANVPADDLNPEGGYQALKDLHAEFSKFSRPRIVDGIPDYSLAAMKTKEEGLVTFRKRLAEIDPEDWTISQKVDYLLMRSMLNALDFQLRITRPWERDPSTYVDMIARIPYSNTPLQNDAKARLKARLKTVPKILDLGKANLKDVPRVLAEIALRTLERSDGVNQGEPRRKVPPEGTIGWPYTVEDVVGISEVELYRTLAFLRIEQHKNRNLPRLEPATTEEEHERRVREAETLTREFIKKHDLMTIPDYIPSEFETDAFWIVRQGGKRHFWEEITYRDPLNNHIHASIPGHRFDGLIQRRHKNPIRRTFGDGGRAEGWTFYLEEMFLQAGLLENRPRTKELFYIAQLKRVLRIPAELNMQSGNFSLDQAIQFLIDEVPMMDENLARYDLQIYIRRPAYGMTYLTGKVQMEKLLADRAYQLGEGFDLGKFHDEFLAAGPIPISLIRWEMTGLDDEVKIFWQE